MHITFIQTGGTIDKDYPRTTNGYAFEIAEPAAERLLSILNPSFTYDIVTACQKDSQEITTEDREKIVSMCKEASTPFIIITHGTDTLIATALYLQKVTEKVIVLTGAMRPERFVDSDAGMNLGTAIAAVSILPPGVYVAMHGRVIPAEKARREPGTGKFC